MDATAQGLRLCYIQYCDEQGIDYAIRVKRSASMREQIVSLKESAWQPLLDRQGKPIADEDRPSIICEA